jgi:hypothetical protein
MEEMDAENAEDSTGLGEDTDIARDEDSGDTKEANKSDERAVKAEDWLELDLPYWRDALLLQQTLSNGPKRIISLIFDKGGSERGLFRYTFGEWAEMLGLGMLDVYSAARKLSLEFELQICARIVEREYFYGRLHSFSDYDLSRLGDVRFVQADKEVLYKRHNASFRPSLMMTHVSDILPQNFIQVNRASSKKKT